MVVRFASKYQAKKVVEVVVEAATAAEDAEAAVEIETEKEALSEATDVVLEASEENADALLHAPSIKQITLSFYKLASKQKAGFSE